MRIELKIPAIGESITEAEIGAWLKAKGDRVQKDEPVVSLESEKATVELPAPEAGTVAQLLKQKGEVAKIGEVIGYLETEAGTESPARTAEKTPAEKPLASKAATESSRAVKESSPRAEPRVMPAAQRALAERGLRPEQVQATGPGGRVLKEDVLRQSESNRESASTEPPGKTGPVESTIEASESEATAIASVPAAPDKAPVASSRDEEVVPMSRLRRTVAERLVQSQHTAALLTTFNEIDMSGVLALRKQYGEAFQQKYNVKLGFMSFFIKAAIDALKQFPAVNAEIRGTNIVYHNFYDIGVAVGSGKGLAVPALRNAERLSFAEIEVAIGDFARRAKENKLKVEELQGGTFTISNGGVYGSLLSTPIVNPPQSGVLGMHAIQERPVAREGAVVIRPMMYIALTYDHRLVDGREGVSFLKRVKEAVESPARMLMEV
jgi:2-oxoglutarate dehydrogenase E2 component (dihydrolipoamide succinyltransferase)